MISAVRGAVQQIRKIAKNAIHCSNHALNLSVSKSSTVQSIRNCVEVIKEVTSFFHISAKRNYVLQQHLTNHRKLHNLCETRWIERHDSVLHFKESIIEIIDTLTEISGWQDNISSSKAKMMISAICNCEFIFSLFSLSNLLAVTFPISKILQGKDQDIVAASECIKDVYLILGQNREKCEEKFQSMFKECELILNKLDVDIKFPRIIAHQKHRVNATSSNNPVDYYRINIYIPLLDNVLEDFDFRFLSKENSNITLLIQLIPKYVVKMKTEDYNGYFAKIIEIMTKDYTYFQNVSEQAIENEINMWFTKWLRLQTEGKNIPVNGLDALSQPIWAGGHRATPVLDGMGVARRANLLAVSKQLPPGERSTPGVLEDQANAGKKDRRREAGVVSGGPATRIKNGSNN
ncbi:zinc finger MYM-type protein 1-like [Rhopalosiphum maidis]|uniref:zinc finger MYM-type protein 1-like n=1 Tax=Rhopalosiphum maidis TaxID=43146 RepID=UPI000EFE3625|nr:zinc finger MYM-type protein 1-like [Rhopalosiphum maidis]